MPEDSLRRSVRRASDLVQTPIQGQLVNLTLLELQPQKRIMPDPPAAR